MIDIEKYLDNFFRGTKDTTLSAMKYFMNEYNNFEKEINFIHIAGTNGKGSCAEMISNILIKAGYKVGKFLSPHLIKYNERISVNGNNITDKEMSDLIEELQPKIDKYNEKSNSQITIFELETIMGLLYFYRKNVDFVVLETGLGGLYDCTNIITKPIVSIITSIGYDHMRMLGNTLPEIAYQKAGIIKNESNTIFFSQSEEVDEVFKKVCKEKNNKLHLIKNEDITNFSYDKKYQYFDYKNMKNIEINLKGMKQINNASVSIECIKILNDSGFKISEENIRSGLKTVIHKGRMEILCEKPLVVFDGAHNEPAIDNLKQTVNMYYKNYKKVFIISILKRKDYRKIIKDIMYQNDATFILTSGNDENIYASKDELYEEAMKYKTNNQIIMKKDLESAIDEIKTESNEVNFIIGSFYVYGNAVNGIQKITNK